MGRTLPTHCPHGGILDWGDFGDEWSPYRDLCPECVPPSSVDALTREYRMANRDWLEEFHRAWYRLVDLGGATPR